MNAATPAIVALERAGVDFVPHEFEVDSNEQGYGLRAARALGVDPDRVFKTLLATVSLRASTATSAAYAVGIVPVSVQLSLKELAVALGGKRAEMCDPTVAERLTGYVIGGISPFGQKRRLPTVIDEGCMSFETIFVSGGRRGLDLELAPAALVDVLSAVAAPIGQRI